MTNIMINVMTAWKKVHSQSGQLSKNMSSSIGMIIPNIYIYNYIKLFKIIYIYICVYMCILYGKIKIMFQTTNQNLIIWVHVNIRKPQLI